MKRKAEDIIMTKDFEVIFVCFIELVPLRRLSIGTRKILLFYLLHETDFEDFAGDYFHDVANLFELLDQLEEMIDQSF
jgi:hypothetical protein